MPVAIGSFMHPDEISILEPDSIDFEKYLKETDTAEKVRPASDYLALVMHELAPAYDTPSHPKMPFANNWLYFMPGEVTAWAGFNGSGKSMLQGQVMATLVESGSKACIASLEMKPEKTIARIARQVVGHVTPSRDQVSAMVNRLDGRMWLYDQQGDVKASKMIAVIKHCAENLGIQQIAIDSLMKCIRGTDDYNGQKDFVNQLTVVARDYKIHIHLVAHLKKGDGDERMPTRYDMKGCAEISDLVDNVVLVWRNKRKERQRDAGETVAESEADAILIVDKSRNCNWEGRTKLWFNRNTLRFSDYYRSGIV